MFGELHHLFLLVHLLQGVGHQDGASVHHLWVHHVLFLLIGIHLDVAVKGADVVHAIVSGGAYNPKSKIMF